MTLVTLHASYGMVNIVFLKYVLAMSIDRIYAYRQIVCNLFRQLGNFWIAEPEKMNIPGSKGWDSDYPRVTTWAVMLDKVSGKRFFYMNTHLDHIGRDARHEGAKLLLAQATRLSEGLPVMMSGDFNATPKDDPILVMTDPTNPQSLINTRRSAKFVYGPDWSFHDFGRIKPSERPWLDYIFVDRRWTALTCACRNITANCFPQTIVRC